MISWLLIVGTRSEESGHSWSFKITWQFGSCQKNVPCSLLRGQTPGFCKMPRNNLDCNRRYTMTTIQVWCPVQSYLRVGRSYRLEMILSSTCLTVHTNTSLTRVDILLQYVWADKRELLLSCSCFPAGGLLERMCGRGFFSFCWQSTQREGSCVERTRVSYGILPSVSTSFIFKLLSGCIYVCSLLKAQPGSLFTNLCSLAWHWQNPTQHV